MNNESPWSAYGRRHNPDGPIFSGDTDPTFGAAREAMRTHEQLKQYLARALQEYNEIRAGRAGYARIVADALRPPPRPESIEETLRRLSGARRGGNPPHPDPSSTV